MHDNEKAHFHKKKIDDLISEIRSVYFITELISGKSEESIINDQAREYIKPLFFVALRVVCYHMQDATSC